jgi:hypothetical protein
VSIVERFYCISSLPDKAVLDFGELSDMLKLSNMNISLNRFSAALVSPIIDLKYSE